jgi:hypothetical protein
VVREYVERREQRSAAWELEVPVCCARVWTLYHSSSLPPARLRITCTMLPDHYKDVIKPQHTHAAVVSPWREIQVCNDNFGGESKSQNFHESLLDLTFLIAATATKTPIY